MLLSCTWHKFSEHSGPLSLSLDKLVTKNQWLSTKCQSKFLFKGCPLLFSFQKQQQKFCLKFGVKSLVFSHWSIQWKRQIMWIIKSFVSINCDYHYFFKVNRKQYPGGVTSLAMINKRLVLIGTDDGSIYQLDILTFDDALLSTCHTGAILDIAFPKVWYCHFFQSFNLSKKSNYRQSQFHPLIADFFKILGFLQDSTTIDVTL